MVTYQWGERLTPAFDVVPDQTSSAQDILQEQSAVLDQHSRTGQVGTDSSSSILSDDWQQRESRNELRHISGITTADEESEIEYRKIRLERVVLVGIWSSQDSSLQEAEESLRELSALAQTAGAVVVDGVLQHRARPDAATYVGSGKARD